MSREVSSLEITSKVIDLGASIVPLAAVARAGVVVQHPLQSAGIRLLGLAGVLFAFEASPFGSGLRFPPRPSMLLWAICIVAALGVFMIAFARRRLVIATAAGETITLPPADAQFAAAVTNCIREAVEHVGPVHYRIDLAQRTIASVPPSGLAPAGALHAGPGETAQPHPAIGPGGPGLGSPGLGAPGQHGFSGVGQQPGGPATAASPFALPPANGNTAPPYQMAIPGGSPSAGMAHGQPPVRDFTGPPTGQHFGAAQAQAHGRPNGAAYRNGSAEPAGLDGDLVRRLDSLGASAPHQGAQQAPYNGPPTGVGAFSMPGGPIGGHPQPAGLGAPGRPAAAPMPMTLAPPENGLAELLALIRFVERADVQHKQALLDLLRVVESWRKGGATSREDAMAHWQSFADYVQQYLGGVDGLAEATHRTARGLTAEPGLRM